jgi:sugar lactone lactonase YvrE
MIPMKIQGKLVYRNMTDIGHRTVLAESVRPSAVAYDPVEQRIYWSDVALNQVFRQFLNGTMREVYMEDSIGTVDGLAIDWKNRIMFFSNVLPLFNQKSKGIVLI